MSTRLSVGEPAPPFTLAATSAGEQISVSLADYRGRSAIVYFYPAAGTPGCTTEACDFRDSLAQLNAAGMDVLAISPDAMPALLKFADAQQLTFPLLSDPDHTVLEAYGAWGEKSLYGKKVVGVIRSTFVVGPDGVLTYAAYNVKATGHVAKLRRDLEVA